jgi:hypothetical protein
LENGTSKNSLIWFVVAGGGRFQAFQDQILQGPSFNCRHHHNCNTVVVSQNNKERS